MQPVVIKTEDGSHSLFVEELNEHYHSIHGAIQESKHVFIESGLKHIAIADKSKISILEIGLGTGLNAFLTFLENETLNRNIHYTTIEAFPIDMTIVNQLNYPNLLGNESKKDIFTSIHSSAWELENSLSPNFTLLKIKDTLQNIKFTSTFDLVYFDAFGPQVQPDMWKESIFAKIANALHTGSILVTYCAKGEVKRTLKRTGFLVESLPGPPGKREMIRAIKI